LKLLVSARWQGHERTRTLEVERAHRYALDLRANDTAMTLWPRLLVERDGSGGYGSAEATRQVVRALLETGGTSLAPAAVRVTELSAQGKSTAQKDLSLATDSAITLQLSTDATGVRIESSAPGVLVRAQRPLFRSYLFAMTSTARSPSWCVSRYPRNLHHARSHRPRHRRRSSHGSRPRALLDHRGLGGNTGLGGQHRILCALLPLCALSPYPIGVASLLCLKYSAVSFSIICARRS
jgi:hypothetical protein